VFVLALCCTRPGAGEAEPVDPGVEQIATAIEQVRTSTNFAPREAFALLERWAARWPAESPRGREMAARLLEALRAPDTTPLGRITLAQHLALVAGEPERAELRRVQGDPSLSEAARIALGGTWPALDPRPIPELERQLASTNPAVRLAALSELAHTYPDRARAACESALADSDARVAATAIQWLARLDGARLVVRLDELPPWRQATALEALADRGVAEGRRAAIQRLDASEPELRAAAVAALGALGTAADVPLLARLGAVDALAAILDPAADREIAAGIAHGPPEQRVACVRALGARGAPGLLAIVSPLVADPVEEVRRAALNVLGRHGDRSALETLIGRLREEPTPELEQALKQLGQRLNGATVLQQFVGVLDDVAASPAARASVLRILPAIESEEALGWLERYLDAAPPEVRDAAVRSLAQWRTPAAVPALLRLRASPHTSPAHRQVAHDALARLAPRLVQITNAIVYLDCGSLQRADGLDGVAVAVRRGQVWRWANTPPGTVAFDPQEVLLEVTGLSPTGRYELGLSWWDYDAGGREQSVWIAGQPAVPRTPLPNWTRAEQPPAVVGVPIPAEVVTREAPVTIAIRREAGPNAVVGEVWVRWRPETAATLPLKSGAGGIDVRANTGALCRVLVVTGEDLAGHRWRETTPRLAAALAADPRLEVSVAENPALLATPAIEPFRALVLHFQNDRSPPSHEGLSNLRRVVSNGCGLVIVHFASGAFFDHSSRTVLPAYAELAGRVWNPKLRPHDPRGPFTVHIRDPGHPVVLGLTDFETDDELYTCLDGSAPVRVLADAVSKVDGRPYPVAFIHQFGRGRVFHCSLGHDVRAWSSRSVGALYRRGTVWAANLPPGEFRPEGGAFSFDTGELRGRLRDGGLPRGLAPLIEARSGRNLAQRNGVLSVYRLLEPDRRYPDGWERTDTVAHVLPDGSVQTLWPATTAVPFELRATWRWASANAVDLALRVEARAPLRAFEVFCASYFAGFERAMACVRASEGAVWFPADSSEGAWHAFPRDEAARALICDGRWGIPPHPVEWTIRPVFAQPVGVRMDAGSSLAAMVIGRAPDCFAVLMPHHEDPHRSLYLSLFGRDFSTGESASTVVRLLIVPETAQPPAASLLDLLQPVPSPSDAR